MVRLSGACGPSGQRLYAVGDVHGCRAALAETGRRIARDLARRPVADWRFMLLGDLVDRGPDSRGVLDWVVAEGARLRITALLGNHDAMLRDFLADPDAPDFYTWLHHGGLATLRSYGIEVDEAELPGSAAARAGLRDRLAAAMPPAHRRLLEGLRLWVRAGDFVFVHAGIRPGVPMARQTPEDLVWIREPFLSSTADHGAVVVHGHTPERAVALRQNRIGIDQGAVFGGELTCLVIDGREIGTLEASGVVPLGVDA
jgi:serine/threonine protein phosphatase 1